MTAAIRVRSSSPGIPGTLVRLKLRLLANRARSSSSGQVQLAMSCLLALSLGVGGAAAAVAVGRFADARAARDVIVLGSTAILLAWALLPLITFGSDESLDPARLVLFPLQRQTLMRGLLLTAFVGPAPAAVVLVVLGAIVGYASGVGTIVVIAAMVLLLGLSAALARSLTTALAAGLTSRRGRDALLILVPVLAVSVQGLRFLRYSADFIERLVDIARWTPPGMLGQAVIDARTGSLGVAVLELLPAAVLIPLLLRWWASTLDRASTVVSSGQSGRRQRAEPTALPLIPARLSFLVGRPWGAVTARELRYLVREPRRKVALVNSLIFGVGLPLFFAIRSSGDGGSRLVLLSTVTSYIVILGSSNQFGMDGAAAWIDLAAGDKMRAVLVGKNVATIMQVLPIVTVVGAVLAAITGGWVYLPAAVVLSFAGLGVGLASANVISVSFPVRLPENASPFGGTGGGQGCSTGLILGVCILVQNILLLPVVASVAGAAFVGPVWLLVVVPLAAIYGVVMWLVGIRLATNIGRERGPEILIKVDPARTG